MDISRVDFYAPNDFMAIMSGEKLASEMLRAGNEVMIAHDGETYYWQCSSDLDLEYVVWAKRRLGDRILRLHTIGG